MTSNGVSCPWVDASSFLPSWYRREVPDMRFAVSSEVNCAAPRDLDEVSHAARDHRLADNIGIAVLVPLALADRGFDKRDNVNTFSFLHSMNSLSRRSTAIAIFPCTPLLGLSSLPWASGMSASE